jgi:hypothetical protein
MSIHAGDLLEVVTAHGDVVHMRAIGEPTRGRDFAVVWVCTEAEYEEAEQHHAEPRGIPWPLEAVRTSVGS